MNNSPSRRQFFKRTGAVSAAAMLGTAGLSACGSSSSTSTPAVEDPLLSLSASQVVTNIKNGTLKAETYMTTMIVRAKVASGLNAMIFLNETAALAAAKAVDAAKAAGAASRNPAADVPRLPAGRTRACLVLDRGRAARA